MRICTFRGTHRASRGWHFKRVVLLTPPSGGGGSRNLFEIIKLRHYSILMLTGYVDFSSLQI